MICNLKNLNQCYKSIVPVHPVITVNSSIFLKSNRTWIKPNTLIKNPEIRTFSNVSTPSNQESSKKRVEEFRTSNENKSLKDFILEKKEELPNEGEIELIPPYLERSNILQDGKKVYIESYGCQMNSADTEIVLSIMQSAGFKHTDEESQADVVLLNTCAIREKAESKIWDRLGYFKNLKKKGRKVMVGVLGCMAERLKTKLLESDKLVDLVLGPDAYRDLPKLVAQVEDSRQPAINVLLSQDETYADVTPVRPSSNGVTAFISIMRGCNNMCSYCIVPFTRGRERSRNVLSIENEVKNLYEEGYKEVTLLGQNVNSYNYIDDQNSNITASAPKLADGFKTVYKAKEVGVSFTELMDRLSKKFPEMRFRFTSPHPKDFPEDLLSLIKERPNLCKSLHIPAQSGSTTVLDRMRRGYSKESYLDLIKKTKEIIPNCAISSDFISGFCDETDKEHEDTIDLLDRVKYEQAFMFAYSLREKTHAHRHYKDNIPSDVKIKRLTEVIQTFTKNSELVNRQELNKTHLVLIEHKSKKSNETWSGRTDTNKTVNIPNMEIPTQDGKLKPIKIGDFVEVKITSHSSHSLGGQPLRHSSITQFHNNYINNQTLS